MFLPDPLTKNFFNNNSYLFSGDDMIILGLNYYFHDSSACVLINGELIVAIEEERFSRYKHTHEFPNMK